MTTRKYYPEDDARGRVMPEVAEAKGPSVRQVEAREHWPQRRTRSLASSIWVPCLVALALAVLLPDSAEAQFPRQALGYSFDAAPDVFCLAAGGTWALDHAGDYGRCTVAPSGHVGRTAVTFCGDGLPCTVSFGTAGASAVAAAWRDLVAPAIEEFHGSYGPRVDGCVRAFIDDPSASRASCPTGTQQGAATIEIRGGMVHVRFALSSDPARSHLTVTYISPRNSSDFRTAGGASSDSVALRNSTRALPWGFRP
jgi:hypothetical protein